MIKGLRGANPLRENFACLEHNSLDGEWSATASEKSVGDIILYSRSISLLHNLPIIGNVNSRSTLRVKKQTLAHNFPVLTDSLPLTFTGKFKVWWGD